MLPSRNRYKLNRRLIAETGSIPAGLRLIRDTFDFKVLDQKECIAEDAKGREMPVMRATGMIQSGNTRNANSRYYSTNDVLRPAVEAIQDDIAQRAVLGEYDHPSDAKIHLDRVSHLMSKVWMEGNKVYGEIEILHRLPCGAALRGLFEHKVRVGISSRGVGDMEIMESNGEEIYKVMPGYTIVTWDAVAEPSVSGAILNIQESLNKRIKTISKKKKLFSESVYNDLLVKEIDSFFGIKPKKITKRTSI